MKDWINLTALAQIVVVGLLAGAGLPAVFAVGVRALSPQTVSAGTTSAVDPAPLRPTGARMAVAGVCFAIVLAGIAYGLFLIVKH